MKLYLSLIAATFGLIVLSFFIGKWSVPKVDPVVTQTECIPREVHTTKTVVRNRTINRTVTKPDGTKIETQVVERTGTDVDSKGVGVAVRSRPYEPNWRLTGLGGMGLDGKFVYGGALSRKVAGPLSVGVWGLSSGAGGLSLSVDF